MRKLVTGLCAALLASASVPAFANTTTTNYSLNKPSIGADANNWGNLTNANWDSLDSLIFGIQGTANAACPKAGCTYTGGITGTTASFSGASTFGSTLGVTGLLSAAGGEAITGNLTVSGTTTDTGLATFNGGLTVASGATSLGGTLSVTGAVNLTGSLGAGGNITAAGLQATANGLNVAGGFVLNSGAFTVPAGSISGSEIATGTIGTGNIANGAVSNAQHANMAGLTLKGNASGSAAAPQDLSVSQAQNLLGLLSSGGGAGGSVTIGSVIINWGIAVGVPNGGNGNPEAFAMPYSNGEVAVCSGLGGACSINSLSNSAIVIHNNAGGSQNIYWIVIGS